MHFGFGSRLSVQAMKTLQRKDPVNDQVTDYPFIICFHKCLRIPWVVKARIPTFSCFFWRHHRRTLSGEHRASATSLGQAFHPFWKGWKSGFPLLCQCPSRVGVTKNQFLAHTGSLTGTSSRLGKCQLPSPRGAQLPEAVSCQHFLPGLLKVVLMLQLGLCVAHLDVLELSLCCRAGPPKTSKAAAAHPSELAAGPP